MEKRVIFIGAHSDDIEFQAGGTLAKYQEEGYKCIYIVVTDDCAGIVLDENGEYRRYLLPLESQQLRHSEAEKGAAVFGLKPVFLNFKQRFCTDKRGKRHYMGTDTYNKLSIPGSRECILVAPEMSPSIKLVADIMRQEKPEAVFTHPLDIDPEHRSVCHLVYRAFKKAGLEGNSRLYAWGPSSGGEIIHIKPDLLVDISPYFKTKLEAFYCHRCQVGEKLRKVVNERAETWGEKSGVSRAEAFINILPSEANEYTG